MAPGWRLRRGSGRREEGTSNGEQRHADAGATDGPEPHGLFDDGCQVGDLRQIRVLQRSSRSRRVRGRLREQPEGPELLGDSALDARRRRNAKKSERQRMCGRVHSRDDGRAGLAQDLLVRLELARRRVDEADLFLESF